MEPVSRWCFAVVRSRQRGAVGLGRERGTLVNDVAALNKVEVAGWYWCDRLRVEPLDRPHQIDGSLDVLARFAAAAQTVDQLRNCYDPYPEFQPPADAVAR